MVFAVTVYYISQKYFKVPKEWHDQMQAKCSAPPKNKAFFKKSLVHTPILSIGFGAYAGTLVHAKYFGGMKDVRILETSAWKGFLRFLVLLVMIIPALALLIAVPWTKSLLVLFVFKSMIPAFYAGFVPWAFGNYVCEKLGLMNEKYT
jgi:hypothetical protein